MSLLSSGCTGQSYYTDEIRMTGPSRCHSCPKFVEGNDSLEFVNEVMHFVSANSDEGNVNHPLCDTFYRMPFDQLPIEDFLKIFEEDCGTATCGLAAGIMAKILVENGFEAYTYNFGFANTELTHVVVLVKKKGKLLVFDPFINYSLANQDSSLIDLIELFKQVKKQEDDIIYSSNRVTHDLIVNLNLMDSTQLNSVGEACKGWFNNLTAVNDSIVKKRLIRTYDSNVTNPCSSFILRFENQLAAKTQFTKLHQGMTMKINQVWGAEGSQRVDSLINSSLLHLGFGYHK